MLHIEYNVPTISMSAEHMGIYTIQYIFWGQENEDREGGMKGESVRGTRTDGTHTHTFIGTGSHEVAVV